MPLSQSIFCSPHCQSVLHFSPHVLYSFLHSLLTACSVQFHLIFHFFTFSSISLCDFLFLLQRMHQRIIRSTKVHMPYLFFDITKIGFQPFLALLLTKGICFHSLLSRCSLANWRLFIEPNRHQSPFRLLQAMSPLAKTCYSRAAFW